MRRVSFLAGMLALVSSAAWAQHEAHDMAAEVHAQTTRQAAPPSPTLPAPTAEDFAHAFPDLGDMDMRDHMDDDPFIATLALDRLETFRANDANALDWELHGWAGYRRDRFAWRSRGERSNGSLRHGELELLWSRATGAWWNRTLGLRHDSGEGEHRDWLALGVEGTAPYKIDVAATLYAGEGGLGARIEASYDLLLTRRFVLEPRLEADAYSGSAAPPASFEAALRLRYEISRQFAPYLGYAWSTTSDGDASDGGHWIAGIRAWF